VLLQEVEVACRDGVGVEQGIGAVGGLRASRAADAAIDHHMGDMDALGAEFAGHALRQPAQGELAHGERRRLGIALDACRRAREQDGAAAARQHAARRFLRYQEAAERRHRPVYVSWNRGTGIGWRTSPIRWTGLI
jgi:hypothetical protein